MKKINGKNTETKEHDYKKSIIRRTLLTTTIILILLTICNLSEPAKKVLNKYIFETNYNFSLTDGKDKTVSTNKNLEYTSVKDYKDGAELTVSENYNVKMLESGLVVFIGEKEGYGNSIIVQQSNGIDVTYGNVTTTDIKVYDYIEKGSIIGVANEKLYLNFTKDGETLDYKTYIK